MPKAIILTLLVFAGFIGTMVYWMCRENIDLVRDDYYQNEIAYQRHIEQVANAKPFNSDSVMRYSIDSQQITLQKPAGLTAGKLLLYCPADRRQDVRIALTSATPHASNVPMRGRQVGLWRAQLSWSDGHREYYTERPFTRP